MRLFATALALCGCNQIYGLDPTTARDAAPDARDSQIRLSLLVGSATTVASEAPAFLAKVSPDPKPRIALADAELANEPYVEDTVSGTVAYPFEYIGKPWRLEYTPPASVPHEVQWSPADGAGHLIVPVVGRVERMQVPAHTGYSLSMELPSLYTFSASTVIYTSGYWSATSVAASTTEPQVDFSIAPSMSGPAGAPSATSKDFVFAIDYTTQNNCRVVKAAGTAPAVELEPGAMKKLVLTRETSSEQVELATDGESPLDARSRLNQVLGPLNGDSTGSTQMYVRLAHSGLPGFTTSVADVPAPLLVPLADCPITQQPPPVFDVGGALSFTKGIFIFVSNDRIVNGVRLRSSIAAMGGLKAGTISTYVANLEVPCARDITLGGTPLEVDGASIGTEPIELKFGVESKTSHVFDYFEVTLYRLAATALEPVRTYVGPDPTKLSIRFEPKLMLPNEDYVFAIRTYRGRPNARNGDFQPVQAPQAVATIFTRTFKR